MFRAKSANMAGIVARDVGGVFAGMARVLDRSLSARRSVGGSRQREASARETYFAARLPTPSGWSQVLR